MAEKTRNELKQIFKSGNIPTEMDFSDLIDSFWNIEDQGSLPSGVTGPTGPAGGVGPTGPSSEIYYDAGNSSITTTIDWLNGNVQELNLDDDPSLSLINGTTGKTLKLLLKQSLDGQRTITWANDILWSGGISPLLITLPNPGTIDNTFAIGTGFDSIVNSIQVQQNGKILVGGYFTSYDGNPSNYIIRLNPDGTIDNSFTIGTGFNSIVNSIQVQQNGKILVGGNFTLYDGNSASYIVRLNSDGTIDNTFAIGTGFDSIVNSIQVQQNGKILVGGYFTSYDGNPSNYIIRLNPDGTIDNTFAIGTGFDNAVFSIGIQSDGKILAGGDFTTYDGNSSNRIIRLNTDGTVDNTFIVGAGFNGIVFSVTVQSDGKILAGGAFTTYDGNSSNYIIRLNSDGTIDNTFAIGTGFDNTVNPISIQSDGKILAGGDFSTYDGNSVNRIIRLNTDGTVDNTFTIGTGFNSFVVSIATQSDGKILVGGGFTSYDINSVNYIIRIAGINMAAYNKVEFDYNGTYYIGSF